MNDPRRRPTIVDLVSRSLQRHPGRVAFATPDGDLSYGELRRLIARIAAALRGGGVRPGDGVALIAPNRPEAFAAMVAAQSLGARYTPLHAMGSPADHAIVCEDAGIAALIADEPRYAETLAAELRTPPRVFGLDALAAAEPDTDDIPTVARESDIAFLAYTGGTTGRPKGVMLSHRSLVTHVLLSVAHWQLPTELRFLGSTPLTHALAGMAPAIFHQAGSITLTKGFDPAEFCEIVRTQRITATFLVPSMIYVLLDHVAAHPADLSSLRTILYGAAPMSPDRLEQALDVFGPVFVQFYGQTEAPNTVTTLSKQDHELRRLASCGKPHPALDVAVLDDHDQPCAVGELGEVCVRGPLLMDGYWRQPELTAEALRNGWLHTGDIGRFDEDNYLYLADRKKDMLITGGFNVYPREVEDALAAHPDVAAAAVIGVPDPKWGEAVTAFVVRTADATATAEELIAHVRELKGPVHAPKRLDFVDGLPLTPLGKIDKKRLRARFWDAADRAVN
ncbi:AMP-binding protein [Nonomuraea sp. PA05]|uniref:AMP-binding protein n=1 Tax=Nonomuraea sp. PA05 TaxID=2604466 RepID=UPI0011D7D948|nr:AMP-binding protein [Nonomuraea sp. PA05]TYB57434.1 AMP-binding protein [Nonomuraea sp. PA05]